MKRLLKSLAAGVTIWLLLGAFSALADLEVSTSVRIQAQADFYAPLSAHGTWVEVDSYGRCWHPARVAVAWRPYCDGSWVWTDCGWYWLSDEPWAWACYHYGWWVYHPRFAWIWVPGIEWGPAWVSWRIGGGYVGWAPLPPPHLRVTVPAPPFAFVEVSRFNERVKPSTVIVNNTAILNKTTEINAIKRETRNLAGAGPQKVVVNEGPGLEPLQKATSSKLRVVPIQDAVRQTPVPPAMRKMTEPKPAQVEAPPPATKPVSPVPGPSTPPKQAVPAPDRPPSAPPAPKPSAPPKGKEKGGKPSIP